MANPYASEVAIKIDGTAYTCKLTLGALAELEAELSNDNLIALIERLESGAFRASDILAILIAGLRGGGSSHQASDLLQADIEGGLEQAARVAAKLVVAAFAPFSR